MLLLPLPLGPGLRTARPAGAERGFAVPVPSSSSLCGRETPGPESWAEAGEVKKAHAQVPHGPL